MLSLFTMVWTSWKQKGQQIHAGFSPTWASGITLWATGTCRPVGTAFSLVCGNVAAGAGAVIASFWCLVLLAWDVFLDRDAYSSYCGGGPLCAGMIAIGSATGNDLVVVAVGSTVVSGVGVGVGSTAATGVIATVDSLLFSMVNIPSVVRW